MLAAVQADRGEPGPRQLQLRRSRDLMERHAERLRMSDATEVFVSRVRDGDIVFVARIDRDGEVIVVEFANEEVVDPQVLRGGNADRMERRVNAGA